MDRFEDLDVQERFITVSYYPPGGNISCSTDCKLAAATSPCDPSDHCLLRSHFSGKIDTWSNSEYFYFRIMLDCCYKCLHDALLCPTVRNFRQFILSFGVRPSGPCRGMYGIRAYECWVPMRIILSDVDYSVAHLFSSHSFVRSSAKAFLVRG